MAERQRSTLTGRCPVPACQFRSISPLRVGLCVCTVVRHTTDRGSIGGVRVRSARPWAGYHSHGPDKAAAALSPLQIGKKADIDRYPFPRSVCRHFPKLGQAMSGSVCAPDTPIGTAIAEYTLSPPRGRSTAHEEQPARPVPCELHRQHKKSRGGMP